MKASERLVVNTLAQYGRTIINICLSLYSSRLVLEILGESDFGIYSLVGGVVALLSFFTNSLVASTQRFLSIAQGKRDYRLIVEIFNNSMIIHVVLGIIVVLVLFSFTPLLFNGFLNIPIDRINIAKSLYYIVLGMLFTTFITAPFRAVMISHENIVYISIVDVFDGILKLILVLLLPFFPVSKLMSYGWIMLSIQLFNLLALSIYDYKKYEECIKPTISHWKWSYCMELLSFAGWTMYAAFCIAGRNQGLAIVLNKLMGTIINASYGIGMQLSGYLSFLSSSFITAIAPQLMKAEGGDERSKAINLSIFQSKISFLLMGLIAIPALFEIKTILSLWLKNVPDYTYIFATMFIIGQLIDQTTIGLSTMVNATGKIRNYILLVSTPKFLILPAAWIILNKGYSLWYLTVAYFFVESFCAFLRLHVLKSRLNLNIITYCNSVYLKIVGPVFISIIVCWLVSFIDHMLFRFFLTFIIGTAVFLFSSYIMALTSNERRNVSVLMTEFRSKISKKTH